jgi:hypothetical protein
VREKGSPADSEFPENCGQPKPAFRQMSIPCPGQLPPGIWFTGGNGHARARGAIVTRESTTAGWSTCSGRTGSFGRRCNVPWNGTDVWSGSARRGRFTGSGCRTLPALPGISSKGLCYGPVEAAANKVLAHAARQLPEDWQRRCGYRPLLLETVVDGRRFAGIRHRAANWILLTRNPGA